MNIDKKKKPDKFKYKRMFKKIKSYLFFIYEIIPNIKISMESLILAQDERWRHA